MPTNHDETLLERYQREAALIAEKYIRPSCPYFVNGQCSAKSCEGCTAHLIKFHRRQE